MISRRHFFAVAGLPVALSTMKVTDLAVADERVASAAPRPVSMLALTSDTGALTAVAEGGVDDPSQAFDGVEFLSPGEVSGNSGIHGASAGGYGSSYSPQSVPYDDADAPAHALILTDPLEVDEFVVAGVTWDSHDSLPDEVSIYLRSREGDQWTPWFLSEVVSSGPEGTSTYAGTEEFVTGSSTAIQAAVVGPAQVADRLPANLHVALVPPHAEGKQILHPDDLVVTDAQPTPIYSADDVATSSSGSLRAGVAHMASPPIFDPTLRVNMGDSTHDDSSTGASTTVVSPANTPVPVTARSAWGAKPGIPEWEPEVVSAHHVVVHHTAGTNNYTADQSASVVQGIYHYHSVVLDWGDIGYNFLVDKFGRVFEGRYGSLTASPGTMVIGGHARGVNTGSMGISMLGDYSSIAPSQATMNSVSAMAAWFLAGCGYHSSSEKASVRILTKDRYPVGTVLQLPRIFAHRDVGMTACPGNMGYQQMDHIRQLAQNALDQRPVADPRGQWQQDRHGWWWKNPDGSYPTSSWQHIRGAWYIFDARGYIVTEWLKHGDDWYYMDPVSGAMRTGEIHVDGKDYLLSSAGTMVTGWHLSSDGWHYYAPDGHRQTGWVSEKNSWYYLDPHTAVMVRGERVIGTKTYAFGSDGAMITGWKKFDDGWSYFASSGARQDGWVKSGAHWYYMDPSSGRAVTSWAKVKGAWYYFDPEQAMMRTGWIRLHGSWYYLDPASGRMVTGERTISGVSYRFDSSGRWIEA